MPQASQPVRIKVCCIQSAKEAHLTVSNGAHAIGLVSQMPSGSGFMISDAAIGEIIRAAPPTVSTVLLTSEKDPAQIIEHQQATHANTLQLLGPIQPEHVQHLREALPGISLTVVISVVDSNAVEEALRFSHTADALLLDSKVNHRQGGGTGLTHDWSISRRIVDASPLPVWLAGGLSPENVVEAIRTVSPYGVDVCSSLRPNRHLDAERLKRFVKNASGVII